MVLRRPVVERSSMSCMPSMLRWSAVSSRTSTPTCSARTRAFAPVGGDLRGPPTLLKGPRGPRGLLVGPSLLVFVRGEVDFSGLCRCRGCPQLPEFSSRRDRFRPIETQISRKLLGRCASTHPGTNQWRSGRSLGKPNSADERLNCCSTGSCRPFWGEALADAGPHLTICSTFPNSAKTRPIQPEQ